MNTYETVFILDNRKVDDRGEGFSRGVRQHIESLGGSVDHVESLGRKTFARPIGRHRAGVYWDFIMQLDPARVDGFRERYRLDNTVLRLEMFRYEEPES